MDDLVYMTTRSIDGSIVRVWVYRQKCPKCKKALMGKPKDEKTGKIKVRATEYTCEECGHSIPKTQYEESLEAEYSMTCPHCKKDSEGTLPFKRKSIKGVPTLRIVCEKCGQTVDITKKMKEPKKK